jgi:two-component system KDP operon response regulator KdpE
VTESKPRILVVDDEPKLVRLLSEVLTASGFLVLSCSNGERAIEMVAIEQPDLLILDIILSAEVDGFEVARRVREFADVPIIMLTAKARESDLLQGYDAGTDDYLTKPFSSKELLARVHAVLSRSKKETEIRTDAEILCDDLKIDIPRRRVYVKGNEVLLTRIEFNLLRELATHRNQVLNHEQLLNQVWGSEYRDDIGYLRAYIRYLRRKLEFDPANPKWIVTCQGVGYMLECPGDNPDN